MVIESAFISHDEEHFSRLDRHLILTSQGSKDLSRAGGDGCRLQEKRQGFRAAERSLRDLRLDLVQVAR